MIRALSLGNPSQAIFFFFSRNKCDEINSLHVQHINLTWWKKTYEIGIIRAIRHRPIFCSVCRYIYIYIYKYPFLQSLSYFIYLFIYYMKREKTKEKRRPKIFLAIIRKERIQSLGNDKIFGILKKNRRSHKSVLVVSFGPLF